MPRLIELVDSPFGEHAVCTSLSGREEISKPYEFFLSILSPELNLGPMQVVGQEICVRIDRGDQPPRFVHGFVNQLAAGDLVASAKIQSGAYRTYRVRVVPWLWFLTRAARCQVFLPEQAEKTIQAVLIEVLCNAAEYQDIPAEWLSIDNATSLLDRSVEHCVQYRETDFNFFSRTLERYGVHYYFEHTADRHTLILRDDDAYPLCPESEVELAASTGGQMNVDRIMSWEHDYDFVSGAWEHVDYNYMQPSTPLRAFETRHSKVLLPNEGYCIYDNPNDYSTKAEGQSEAKWRLEEEEARFDTATGQSTCKSFSPGYKFMLTGHASCKSEARKSYLITSVQHTAHQPGPTSDVSVSASYVNQFTCMNSEFQYRPPRRSPVPLLASVQSAVVVGPDKEEIHVDELGRVKIKFHWDKTDNKDENHSCWVRASQVHAGRGFGAIDIPRVGEEVIVSFIEGDVDRPIITGRVYNGEAMPPYPLPAEKTRSGYKSKTYKGSGYNELSFDDAPGKQQVRIHAERDMDTTIKRNRKGTVQGNDSTSVSGGQSISVGGDRSINVGGNVTQSVSKDVTETVGGRQLVGIEEEYSLAAKACFLDGEENIRLHCGGATLTIGQDGKIALVTGDSSITLLKSGTIEIAGKFVAISGQDKVSVLGTAVESTARGSHNISGAIVEIN